MTSSLIPVFVFPDGLQFSRAVRRRTVCLYNPYDFGIKFQILATNPEAFSLSSSSGTVRSRHALDVVVRLRETHLSRAKLLVSVVEHSSGQRSGERQIDVTINEDEDNEPPVKEAFAPCVQSGPAVAESRQMAPKETSSQVLTLALAAVCLCVLLLPHDGDHWLRVGVTQKLVVSYVLGLLTFVLLRN